jgi:hypothetical protein
MKLVQLKPPQLSLNFSFYRMDFNEANLRNIVHCGCKLRISWYYVVTSEYLRTANLFEN